jgi:DedD protein
MAFFKFRKNSDESSAVPVPSESVEMMRKRAKYRLTGAAVLVLIGVIGFPMLFDKQPRPIAVDTPIEIPDRNKATPLSIPAPAATPVIQPGTADQTLPTASGAVTASAPEAAKQATQSVVTKPLPAPDIVASQAVAASAKPAHKPIEKAPQQANTQSEDGAKAQALLDGKTLDKKPAASTGRYVVQVGAFADAARAHEARLKVERAGLKTYTQVASTKDGQRIRVRVGPFATRLEADQASEKIKKLALPATLLTL